MFSSRPASSGKNNQRLRWGHRPTLRGRIVKDSKIFWLDPPKSTQLPPATALCYIYIGGFSSEWAGSKSQQPRSLPSIFVDTVVILQKSLVVGMLVCWHVGMFVCWYGVLLNPGGGSLESDDQDCHGALQKVFEGTESFLGGVSFHLLLQLAHPADGAVWMAGFSLPPKKTQHMEQSPLSMFLAQCTQHCFYIQVF